MTSACDVGISISAQTIARNAPRFRALITSRNDRHVWTDQNLFTKMSTEMIKNAVFFVLLSKNTHKTHKIVKVAVNNFAPSLFRSLCEFIGDWFGPRYFSSVAALPQKNTSVQNNHLRFHTMTSKKMVRSYYCLINNLRNSAIQSDEIIVILRIGNAGHYQSTMTPNRDVLTPNRDVMSAKCVFS